jgi:hypothetical protein
MASSTTSPTARTIASKVSKFMGVFVLPTANALDVIKRVRAALPDSSTVDLGRWVSTRTRLDSILARPGDVSAIAMTLSGGVTLADGCHVS